MKYAVIGAGISGLSIANLLNKTNEVVVFESESRPGGMIKCDIVDGCLFHRTGGHVFNTKRADVMDWFWSFMDKEKDFVKADRNSSVFMPDGNVVPYPIENNVFLLNDEIGKNIVSDLVEMASSSPKTTSSNFEDFLKGQFGKTLYELYFQPYNFKVWRRDLSKVPLSWLEGKLPMPSVLEIIYNNIYHVKEKAFVHSSFYYPIRGGSQFLADIFSKGLDIRYNSRIDSIKKTEWKWIVEGEGFDRVIFCGNIKQLSTLFKDCNIDLSGYENAIDTLEYHGTTSVFCEIEANPYSWIYLPNRDYEAHRVICTGNFSSHNNSDGKMTATVEFTDYISKDDILENLKKMPLSPKYLTHHYEEYTYPIQNQNTRQMVSSLKQLLENENFYLCGRFAEWEYANMDVCMGYAMDLVEKL